MFRILSQLGRGRQEFKRSWIRWQRAIKSSWVSRWVPNKHEDRFRFEDGEVIIDLEKFFFEERFFRWDENIRGVTDFGENFEFWFFLYFNFLPFLLEIIEKIFNVPSGGFGSFCFDGNLVKWEQRPSNWGAVQTNFLIHHKCLNNYKNKDHKPLSLGIYESNWSIKLKMFSCFKNDWN